ncbi:riboflavin biosynthesis protein [Rhodococcus opacus]|uniref:Riboflavin biosynthesis protein n=2 Tax=Rhodococcus opacus TaxID=37919 RepID=A0A2S8J588_RHOOP|nr:riboflavin biosynthesis protein [Rhodococcus opacus]
MTRVQQALSDLAAGRAIVLTGSAGGDPDSYLLLAAEKASPAALASMVRHSSGFVCAAVTRRVCDRLGLPPMVGTILERANDWYTVSVDAISGVGTGISAADRARTLATLASPDSAPGDFTRPGHVVPARARENGVLDTRGPAEVMTDLARAAGLQPVGAFAALVSENDPTRIANDDESREFARAHRLTWVSADDVVIYRRAVELHVRCTFTVTRKSPYGALLTSGFRSDATGTDYIAYRIGRPHTADAPWIHLHRESDFAPHADDADPDLQAVFAHISTHSDGVVLVERNTNDLDSYTLTAQQQDRRRVDRNADIAQVIRELGISSPRLLDPPADLRRTLEIMGIEASALSGPHSGSAVIQTVGTSASTSHIVTGLVRHGDQRGRELGFPTANLELDAEGRSPSSEVRLVDGVWAGRCVLPDGRSIAAAVSIGRRSTFYGRVGTRLLEAHLLDFDEDLYDVEVTVHLDHWIRGQSTFASKEELIAALEDDVRHTRTLLPNASAPAWQVRST